MEQTTEAVVEQVEHATLPTTKTKKVRSRRGTGHLYQQKGSQIWWVQYYRHGKRYQESTHTTNKRIAANFLQKRLAAVVTGNFIGPRIEKITVGELVDDLLRQYRTGVIKGQKSLAWTERRWTKHLQPVFGNVRAVEVSTDMLERYIADRQQAKAKNSTVNRELAVISRAFHRGMEAKPAKVSQIPPFPRLEENNVRKGFLTDEQYDRLAAECAREGLWLRTMLAVAHNFGWRKGELLNLRVDQVDLFARTIRLDDSKNSQGRTVKMTEEVFMLLTAYLQGKQNLDGYVFSREDGKRVKDFRKVWRNVCERAGVPGLLFHDLRRTGARNLRRLGTGEGTIMKIGGWKTASVFRRYDIVSEDDLDDAAKRLDEKRRKQAQEKAQKQNDYSLTIAAPNMVQVAEASKLN